MAPLVGNMVLLGIHFPVFKMVRNSLMGCPTTAENFDPVKTWIGGAAGGAAGSIVSCPVELVRTKMTMQRRAALAATVGGGKTEVHYNGSYDCFKKVIKNHGVKGLYRGYTSTLLRDIQGYGWFFLGYEATIQAFLIAGHGHTKEDLSYVQVSAGSGSWTFAILNSCSSLT